MNKPTLEEAWEIWSDAEMAVADARNKARRAKFHYDILLDEHRLRAKLQNLLNEFL